VDTVSVVKEFVHDREAYCQGLVFHEGQLYEGTGLLGKSTLRKVDLETGDVLISRKLPDEIFGEGITIFGDRIYQLTLEAQVALLWDLATLEKVGELSYEGEGWGLTHDGSNLIMSDGSAMLRFRDPETFAVRRELEVTSRGRPVTRLNELEYIDGEIFANIWQRDRIARISPETGEVLRWIDLTSLRRRVASLGDPEVLNGIAHDPATGRLFVTGKNWPRLFEIEIVPKPRGE
jgi:glutamine cyclotransferase